MTPPAMQNLVSHHSEHQEYEKGGDQGLDQDLAFLPLVHAGGQAAEKRDDTQRIDDREKG